mmetsp:Transcript_111435/g.156434  ORF Transcript_111435/g.156434 Transcript_111435/m.156434 type:complete len:128 (-) Transcript_111435:25-408(-)
MNTLNFNDSNTASMLKHDLINHSASAHDMVCDSTESKHESDSYMSSDSEKKVMKKVKIETPKKYDSNPVLSNLVKTLQDGFKSICKINGSEVEVNNMCSSVETTATKTPVLSVSTVQSTPQSDKSFF